MKSIAFVFLVSVCFASCGSSQNDSPIVPDTTVRVQPQNHISRDIPFSNSVVDTTNYPELRATVERLANKIQSGVLAEKKTVQLIPGYILTYMDSVSNGFTMANPNEEWQEGCNVVKPLPSRQLIYFGMSEEIAVLSYRSGGWAVCGHLAVFEVENSSVKNAWIQYAPDTLDTKRDIVAFLSTPQHGNILISSRLDTH